MKPNKTYIFKLRIYKSKKYIKKIKIEVTTLNAPLAILSKYSEEIANGKNIQFKDKLTESQIKIINNCSKLIFEENDKNIIRGNFDGIEIKIGNQIERKNNIYYIAFDINNDYFEKFVNQFLDECQNDIVIPSHFIIQKLPTILFFNLLEKGQVIFTGKRMGGVIAASLAFYIMYIGKSRNINLKYGNPFIDEGKNSIGVVTFGSPLFLNNLYAGIKMKELVSQFINIKEDYDFIPEIIDLIDKKQKIYPELLNIIRKMKFDKDIIDFLKSYLSKKNKFMENINKFKKIPFGYYYIMETKCYSLSIVNENTFNTFYYYIKSDSIDLIPNEISYGKLSLNSNNNFDKLTLDFLEKKEVQLELIKIIRRNIKSKDHNYQKEIKGIIKFKLPFIVHNAISPDIINKINLITKGEKIYEINYKDIY